VDRAETFTEVLDKFNLWLEEKGLGTTHTFALVTDGTFDVGKFLRLSCQQESLEVPVWAEKWLNIRRSYGNFYHTSNHHRLENMLDRLNMKFEGNAHSGLDDAKNIARVVSRMLMDGAVLRVNEKLELQPVVETKEVAPHHKPSLVHWSPISGTEADAWLSTCEQITEGYEYNWDGET